MEVSKGSMKWGITCCSVYLLVWAFASSDCAATNMKSAKTDWRFMRFPFPVQQNELVRDMALVTQTLSCVRTRNTDEDYVLSHTRVLLWLPLLQLLLATLWSLVSQLREWLALNRAKQWFSMR